MEKLKAAMRQALEQEGFQVVEAMPWKSCGIVQEPKLCISIKSLSAEAGACYQYLGLDENGQEQYGMRLNMQAMLTILSPKAGGQETCQVYLEQVFFSLLRGIPGFPVVTLESTEVSYHQVRDCFQASILADTTVMVFMTVTDTGQEITEFRIRAAYQEKE